MGKKKSGGQNAENAAKAAGAQAFWCYYCDTSLRDEKVLIQHQIAKHFTCPYCDPHAKGRVCLSLSGLLSHVRRSHRRELDKVPGATEGRDSTNVEVYAMSGIPEEAIAEWEKTNEAANEPAPAMLNLAEGKRNLMQRTTAHTASAVAAAAGLQAAANVPPGLAAAAILAAAAAAPNLRASSEDSGNSAAANAKKLLAAVGGNSNHSAAIQAVLAAAQKAAHGAPAEPPPKRPPAPQPSPPVMPEKPPEPPVPEAESAAPKEKTDANAAAFMLQRLSQNAGAAEKSSRAAEKVKVSHIHVTTVAPSAPTTVPTDRPRAVVNSQVADDKASVRMDLGKQAPKAVIVEPLKEVETDDKNMPRLYLGKLPKGITEEMIHLECLKYGPVHSIHFQEASQEGEAAWAMVQYLFPDKVQVAVSKFIRRLGVFGAQRPLEIRATASNDVTRVEKLLRAERIRNNPLGDWDPRDGPPGRKRRRGPGGGYDSRSPERHPLAVPIRRRVIGLGGFDNNNDPPENVVPRPPPTRRIGNSAPPPGNDMYALRGVM